MRRGEPNRASVLGALHVGAVTGHDHHAGADANVGGYHHAQAIVQDRRLVGGGGRLPLDGGLGLGHLEHHPLRQFHGDRHSLMRADRHRHVLLQIHGLLANHVLWHGDLVIGFGLHEREALLVLVEIVIGFLLEVGALHLLGRAVALGDFYPIGNAPHVEVGDRRALTWMDVLSLHDDAQLAVDLEHVAFAHRACDNLDHRQLLPPLRLASRLVAAAPKGSPNSWPLSTGLFLHRQGASRPCHSLASQAPGGAQTGMRTDARSCWRADASGPRCGAGSRPRGSWRSKPAPFRCRLAMSSISSPSPPSSLTRTVRTTAVIFTPHPNSRARSCWRPARSASSRLPRCSAIASVETCIIPRLPCWNGIGRVSPTSA